MGDETLVIVGGGLAAARAIEAIRDGGHTGPVVLVSDEPHLPYDRPPLSKAILGGGEPEEAAFLHPPDWYAERHVDVRLGTRATHLDASGHTVTLADDTQITWDRLLLATGSSARRLEVPGAELANVLYLRTLDQATTLRARLKAGGSVVIVGAGWIGLEVSAAAGGHGCEVTVIEPQHTPLQAVVGEQVGRYFTDLHEAHGVSFRFGGGVRAITRDRAVTGVLTTAGEWIPADTVVVGVGATPNTALAEQAGLDVDNGVLCDAALRTSAPDIFAAGDVANWFNPILAQRMRVEHWANAHDGGFAAGRSMLGEQVSQDAVPYFFSDQYDVGLEYAGHVPHDTSAEVILRGDPATNAFLAFWVADGRVLAGMHVNTWDSMDDIQSLIRSRSPVDPHHLQDPAHPLMTPA
ncbi:FAD-dependent oxidoreductase [Nocardioides gansuensis]|uniref:FAD-dependent oxidoreductase n=1 Tax=Nocardioides gansuensis TaxID=2138300 RepID=A0A2T8F6Z7_9ACTN|nr:FAD-dependent oxidoreductase [Nocardioides gansuensis]PVG81469.1 FAD-dependent oxidoreductase [Nocardioides gansuensis]